MTVNKIPFYALDGIFGRVHSSPTLKVGNAAFALKVDNAANAVKKAQQRISDPECTGEKSHSGWLAYRKTLTEHHSLLTNCLK